MAQKFRKVDPRFWDDEKVREFGGDEQRVALYILTSKQANRIGLFSFSLAQAAETLHLEPVTFAQRFGKVIKSLGWRYDPAARVLWVPTWWKYNPPENPNVIKGNLDDLHDLPQTPLIQEFAAHTRYLIGKVGETFTETYQKRYLMAGTMFAESGAGAGAKAGAGQTGGAELFTGAAPQDENGVLTFECRRGRADDPAAWVLTREKLDEYRQTYQGLDVEAEVRSAWQWNRDNPSKRKTARGTPSFLSRWLRNALDRPASRHPGATSRGGDGGSARRERLRAAVRP